MFFLGLFSSPLPYLMLLSIYFGGYAFISLRQDRTAAEDNIPLQIVFTSAEQSQNTADAGTFFWEASSKGISCKNPGIIPVFSPRKFADIAGSPPGWQLLLSCFSIRPPPMG